MRTIHSLFSNYIFKKLHLLIICTSTNKNCNMLNMCNHIKDVWQLEPEIVIIGSDKVGETIFSANISL